MQPPQIERKGLVSALDPYDWKSIFDVDDMELIAELGSEPIAAQRRRPRTRKVVDRLQQVLRRITAEEEGRPVPSISAGDAAAVAEPQHVIAQEAVAPRN